jgi:hypothetical protein
MRRMRTAIAAGLAMFVGATQQSSAGSKPAFIWSHVVAHYTCKTYGSVRYLNAYSQVFPACYAGEISHLEIAQAQTRNADQAAQAACGGGTITYKSLSQGGPHEGSDAVNSANRDRDSDIKVDINFGNMTTSFYVSAPYSGVCQ